MSVSQSTQFRFTGISPTSTISQTGLPPSSSTSTSDSSDPAANATLYLYTFLATLVLLLSVSSAIVVRSLILRRRHQRLVEEAIRTGTWLPQHLNSTTSRRRRDIGQKPKLWEAWLHPIDEDDGESDESEKRKWSDIMPVYAAYVNAPMSAPQGPAPSSAENTVGSPSHPLRFIRPYARRRSSPSPLPATTASPMAGQALSLHTSSPTATHALAVRVAVLIAMPSPLQKHGGDESGPPIVEIGVVEADVKDQETETEIARDRI